MDLQEVRRVPLLPGSVLVLVGVDRSAVVLAAGKRGKDVADGVASGVSRSGKLTALVRGAVQIMNVTR